MHHISNSISSNFNLEKTISRLSSNASVVGVLQIGSLSKNQLTPHSDYDLVIILQETVRPWFVGVTSIDHRFTDLIFVELASVSSFLNLQNPVPHTDPLASVIRWFRDGEILFAHSPEVKLAQKKVMGGDWIEPKNNKVAYDAWFRINYNLAQLKRISQSPDPLIGKVAAIRLAVYGFADVWFGYFDIRKIKWEGDKAAVRYLSKHDPKFLLAFEQFIHEQGSLQSKLKAYEQAATIATAPLGGIWSHEATVMNVPDIAHLWSSLLGEET